MWFLAIFASLSQRISLDEKLLAGRNLATNFDLMFPSVAITNYNCLKMNKLKIILHAEKHILQKIKKCRLGKISSIN